MKKNNSNIAIHSSQTVVEAAISELRHRCFKLKEGGSGMAILLSDLQMVRNFVIVAGMQIPALQTVHATTPKK